jgi:hypothetical protein
MPTCILHEIRKETVATKIKIIRSVDYLSVMDDGTIDFEESRELLKKLAEPKRPPADYEILLDFRRTQWILSTEEIFGLIRSLLNFPDSFRDKIALLVLPGVNFDKPAFMEMCESYTDITIGTFTNYEDAIHWFYVDEFPLSKQ